MIKIEANGDKGKMMFVRCWMSGPVCVSGPTNEEVFKRLESAVNDGRMTVTLTEDGNTYVASAIG